MSPLPLFTVAASVGLWLVASFLVKIVRDRNSTWRSRRRI